MKKPFFLPLPVLSLFFAISCCQSFAIPGMTPTGKANTGENHQAIRENPNNAEAHFNLGSVYFILKQYNEAIISYKEALRIKPDFALAYLNLGWVFGKLDRYEEALAAYKEAIRIDPPQLPYPTIPVPRLSTSAGMFRSGINDCQNLLLTIGF